MLIMFQEAINEMLTVALVTFESIHDRSRGRVPANI
jgi:hypothetical protein